MKGMGWECSFYSRTVKCIQGFGAGGIMCERGHLKDLDIDRKIILKWMLNK
jgi:hypothetical protein